MHTMRKLSDRFDTNMQENNRLVQSKAMSSEAGRRSLEDFVMERAARALVSVPADMTDKWVPHEMIKVICGKWQVDSDGFYRKCEQARWKHKEEINYSYKALPKKRKVPNSHVVFIRPSSDKTASKFYRERIPKHRKVTFDDLAARWVMARQTNIKPSHRVMMHASPTAGEFAAALLQVFGFAKSAVENWALSARYARPMVSAVVPSIASYYLVYISRVVLNFVIETHGSDEWGQFAFAEVAAAEARFADLLESYRPGGANCPAPSKVDAQAVYCDPHGFVGNMLGMAEAIRAVPDSYKALTADLFGVI